MARRCPRCGDDDDEGPVCSCGLETPSLLHVGGGRGVSGRDWQECATAAVRLLRLGEWYEGGNGGSVCGFGCNGEQHHGHDAGCPGLAVLQQYEALCQGMTQGRLALSPRAEK